MVIDRWNNFFFISNDLFVRHIFLNVKKSTEKSNKCIL